MATVLAGGSVPVRHVKITRPALTFVATLLAAWVLLAATARYGVVQDPSIDTVPITAE